MTMTDKHNIQVPLMQFYINGLRYDNQQWPLWTVTGADGMRATTDSHVGFILDRLASTQAELNDAKLQLEAAGRIMAEHQLHRDATDPGVDPSAGIPPG